MESMRLASEAENTLRSSRAHDTGDTPVSCYFLRLLGLPHPPADSQAPAVQVVVILSLVASFAEVFSRRTRVGAALSSSLVAFLAAACISNTVPCILPARSPVYDLFWNHVLPAVLVLLISGVVLDSSKSGKQTSGNRVSGLPSPHLAPDPSLSSASLPSSNSFASLGSSSSLLRLSSPPRLDVCSPSPPFSLSSSGPSHSENRDTRKEETSGPSSAAPSCSLAYGFQTVGVAFLLGAIATVTSVCATYQIAVSILASYTWCPGILYLSRRVAAMCAACVSATYIGGSVNFYAVARTLNVPGHIVGSLHILNGSTAAENSVLQVSSSGDFSEHDWRVGDLCCGAVANDGGLGAADLFLSGIYTAVLAILARHAPWLRRSFPDCSSSSASPPPRDARTEDEAWPPVSAASPTSLLQPANSEARPSAAAKLDVHGTSFTPLPLRVVAVAFCAVYAVTIAAVAARLERSICAFLQTDLHGADTLAVTVLAFCVAFQVDRALSEASLLEDQQYQEAFGGSSSHTQEAEAKHRNGPELAAQVARVSEDVANAGQTLFFAAIGAGARLSDVFAIGPAIFLFTLASLVGHLLVHLILCRLFNVVAGWRKYPYPIPLDECLVASEANVGGPGTAAALAGTMLRRPDLVMPAVVWGTVGYVAATSIGVHLFSFLIPS